VFENGTSYVCEKAVGPQRTCSFRSGMVILQQPVDRAQMTKLLATGKTDLLDKFVSKRNGRAFKAYLVLKKDGSLGFEFEPRAPKAAGERKGKPKEPPVKMDFTGQEPLGQCPKCGGRVFEGPTHYVCEKTQADSRPCKFKTGKVILQQPIDRAQVAKLLAAGRTDLLNKFISKTGRPFPAYLVLDEAGKVSFEFPPREAQAATG
jgi:DNA topoisomerase-3